MTDVTAKTANHPRRIITPEGVALELRIPEYSERLGAFFYDLVRLVVSAILLVIVGIILSYALPWIGPYLFPFVLVGQFLFINGYFIWFEARPRGATPGKRQVGLRVIDRNGGALRIEQIVARNIVRNFEFTMPLLALSSFLSDDAAKHSGASLLCLGVILGCGLLPLFHPDRLRAGDWLAGTLVIAAPRAQLLRDLGRANEVVATHRFTREQLTVYGVYELQVLEDLLRSGASFSREKAETIAQKIQAKIGHRDAIEDPKRFLREFYAEQRAHLERELALGRRKESKLDARKHRA